jgi:chromosome segregation ATPase
MYAEFSEKIKIRIEANNKLKETIQQLQKDELIEQSANLSQKIGKIEKAIEVTQHHMKEAQMKAKSEKKQLNKKRKEEVVEIESALNQQRSSLDQKLEQIESLKLSL